MESLSYIQNQFKQPSTVPITQRLPPKVVTKLKPQTSSNTLSRTTTIIQTEENLTPLFEPDRIEHDHDHDEEDDHHHTPRRFPSSLLKKYNITYGEDYKVKCTYDHCTRTTYKCYMYEKKAICSTHLPKLLAKLRQTSKRKCQHVFTKSKVEEGTCRWYATTDSDYCIRHEKKKKQKL
jgi:hypothetical protein